MNRKLKTLGLGVVAALALTAVMASTASANFTSTAAHTTISGTSVESHKFTAGTGIGAISCTLTLSGTLSGTSQPTMVLTPIFANCKDSLGRTVHANTGTAKFEFTSTAGKGLFHIIGGSITFTVTSVFHCTITITPQTGKNNVSYTQEGNNLKLTFNTNNIHSHISGGPWACGTSATTSSTGTLTGTALLQGNGGAARISVH